MDIRKIKKLINLVEESSISELKISEGEKSVFISRIRPIKSYPKAQQVEGLSTPQKPLPADTKSSLPSPETPGAISGYIFRSPMVGIFYRTPSPNSKAFVEIGQHVNVGDTVCIIEAMKIMNQIETDKSGIIKAIIVESGQTIEYDEPLFIIE